MPEARRAACAGLFGFFAPLTAGASLMAGDGGVASCGASPMATWWSRFWHAASPTAARGSRRRALASDQGSCTAGDVCQGRHALVARAGRERFHPVTTSKPRCRTRLAATPAVVAPRRKLRDFGPKDFALA